MKNTYQTEDYFVSPWNYSEDISKQLNFKEKIKIHDVTLRDGEQQAGLVFRKDNKIRIAEMLAEAGVHRIEAGMPAVSDQDEAAIRDIAKRNLGDTEIFAFARCMKDDVKLAADCGVKGIIVEIPSSGHIIEKAYQWPLEKAIELSIEATQLAKELGLYTVFFPIDASRADITWFLDLIERVATEGHMDALVAVDTFGGISPHAVPFMMKQIKERVNKPLELHFHDDFELGVANTIMGLAHGAEVAHTTVAGIGERAGNAPYEALIMSLKTMYGVDTGIDTTKMYDIAKYIQEISGMPIRPNTPIIGDTLFEIESGIVTAWYKNVKDDAPLELSPFLPKMVGQRPARPVLGKNSGIPSIELYLTEIGKTLDEDRQMQLLRKVKQASFDKNRTITIDEFKELVAAVEK